MSLNKNDLLEIDIVSMSNEGSGIGRTEDNIVVFVPNSAIGDRLLVKILKVKKTLAYGKVEKVLIPSNSRIESDCNVSLSCGGCVYRHISYEEELKIKEQNVKDAVERIGKIDSSCVQKIVSTNIIDGYRNKSQIPIGVVNDELVMGFYSKHSHRINNNLDCKLSPKIFNDISKDVYDFLSANKNLVYREEEHKGYIRHLYLRLGDKTNEVMVCFVVNGKNFPKQEEIVNTLLKKYKNIKSILINVNTKKTNVILGYENIVLYGEEKISDYLCNLKFEISANSFFQVNRDGAELLYSIAKKYASPTKDDTLLDLYCGTGTIGLSMASECKSLYGIEIIEDASINAKKNAKENSIENAKFFCGDAKDIDKNIKPDIIVVDPPRKGMSSETIDNIIKLSPKKLVYVSCNPATLARDLGVLSNEYEIKEITPVDMFPRTSHVESVVLLTKVHN